MKSPPVQYTDNEARQLTEGFIEREAARRAAEAPVEVPDGSGVSGG
jgi:hypothetical protein